MKTIIDTIQKPIVNQINLGCIPWLNRIEKETRFFTNPSSSKLIISMRILKPQKSSKPKVHRQLFVLVVLQNFLRNWCKIYQHLYLTMIHLCCTEERERTEEQIETKNQSNEYWIGIDFNGHNQLPLMIILEPECFLHRIVIVYWYNSREY